MIELQQLLYYIVVIGHGRVIATIDGRVKISRRHCRSGVKSKEFNEK